jgi:predicted ArsR family transcriptional regulator
MTHVDFTIRLIRLARCRVGIAEATTLFVIAGGASVQQTAKILKVSRMMVRGRCGLLKKKGLAESYYAEDGLHSFRATAKGLAICEETLRSQPKTAV